MTAALGGPEGRLIVEAWAAVCAERLGAVVPVVAADPARQRFTAELPTGLDAEQVRRLVPAFTAAMDARDVRVIDKGRFVTVTVRRGSDPLEASMTIDCLATVPTCASLKAVPVGVTEDGDVWPVPVEGGSTVLGGVPGSGKSVGISAVLAALAPRADVQIVGIDMKGGLEMAAWRPRLSTVAGDQTTAIDVLEQLDRLRLARQDQLLAAGATNAATLGWSTDFPLVVAVLDECAEAFAPEDTSKEAKERTARLTALTSRLVRLGRAVGVVAVLATQKPTAESLPTPIRDNAGTRVAMRCTTPEQARAILGDTPDGAPSPTAISRETPGVAVAEVGGELRRVRVAFVPDEVRRQIAQATAHLARPLAELVPQQEQMA
ncbi:FtsK/SpoIIIE domain-containing protein [Blastococcus sp. Marseille-P5729]|uniref:FtsK/SpoIIIE domain-containing protein n=1 Tax=Blastococcus sp. Marseille-P5729 TaxID=2086582 RepID=UPI00131C4CDE|nr:FtsK/SpoIIIE domain-containing protein [Blastococcus sp. Marseille-P5729]